MPVKKLSIPFYEKLSLVFVGIFALGFLMILGKDVLDPMIFGFLFAIMLLPVCNFLETKLRLPRSAACAISILLFIAFIGAIIYLVGTQISNLADDWPLLKAQAAHTQYNLQHWIRSTFHYNLTKQAAYVNNATNKVVASSASVIESTFDAVSSILLFLVFMLIFTFFILVYRRLLFRFLIWVFNEDHSHVVYDIAQNIQSIIRKYIVGLLIEMLIVSSAACIIFWFLDIKYGALLGILVGLFNIIPYIGIFSVLILSSVITFATGTPAKALEVAISVLVLHIIDSNFLLPMVVGKKVQLNALISFLGIVVGEMIWGLSGMFLSIPIIAILKIIFDRIESLKPWGFLLGNDGNSKKAEEVEMEAKAE